VAWLLLAVAILCELVGTLALRRLAEGGVWWAGVLVALGYTASFICLGFALRRLNVGVAYAIWSGIGTTAVSIAGTILFGERLNAQAVAGMALVIIGVAVLAGSGAVSH
jgi:small multidrug resistance pump